MNTCCTIHVQFPNNLPSLFGLWFVNESILSIQGACVETKELAVLVMFMERFDYLKSVVVIKRIKIIGDKSVCE